ncbi:hypothetical protein NE235_03080 [Actinoallomurus spadix]|uniref:hypothetical protein n=1 Tax=Actinoallomurus spadix TaxID=79912 RepID=UPI002093B036|nr:hypothetical protein [Actinoallomurus spadix]MCO5985088.1 hypothetical protein [Actinoallomurus spadix]
MSVALGEGDADGGDVGDGDADGGDVGDGDVLGGGEVAGGEAPSVGDAVEDGVVPGPSGVAEPVAEGSGAHVSLTVVT